MVTFYDRAAVGLRPADPNRLSTRTAQERSSQHMGLTWHHTGAGGNLYRPDPLARLQAIQAYHMDTLGYGDIAYHGAFDADGNTYDCRNSMYVGAHAGSSGNIANRLTNGIVWLEDSRGITPEGIAAWRWWLDLYRLVQYRAPVNFAHRWWAEGHGGLPTACPGDDWDNVIRFTHGNY